jgi:hypothetical protein
MGMIVQLSGNLDPSPWMSPLLTMTSTSLVPMRRSIRRRRQAGITLTQAALEAHRLLDGLDDADTAGRPTTIRLKMGSEWLSICRLIGSLRRARRRS